MGIPMADVDARVIDLKTSQEIPRDATAEIVIDGSRIMHAYWRQPKATHATFVDIAVRQYLRAGDLAPLDEDGYCSMTDRLKRTIKASSFEVWPSEVKALVYRHAAIHEVCTTASGFAPSEAYGQ